MTEDLEIFLLSKRSEVARTIVELSRSRFTECYTSQVHRRLAETNTPTSYHTVNDAIRVFEEKGWITRSRNRGRAKPIELTDDGERVFQALCAFMDVLEQRQDPAGNSDDDGGSKDRS